MPRLLPLVALLSVMLLAACQSKMVRKNVQYQMSNQETGISWAMKQMDKFANADGQTVLFPYFVLLGNLNKSVTPENKCHPDNKRQYQRLYQLNPTSLTAIGLMVDCDMVAEQDFEVFSDRYQSILKAIATHSNGSSPEQALQVRELPEVEFLFTESGYQILDQKMMLWQDKFVYKFSLFDPEQGQFFYSYVNNFEFITKALSAVLDQKSNAEITQFMLKLYLDNRQPVVINYHFTELLKQKKYQQLINLQQEQQYPLTPLSRGALARAYLYSDQLAELDELLNELLNDNQLGNIESALVLAEIMSELDTEQNNSAELKALLQGIDQATTAGNGAVLLSDLFNQRGMREQAEHWLEQSINAAGSNWSELVDYLDIPTLKARLLQQLVDKGELDANYRLALLYYRGDGVAKDLDKEFQLYLMAARKGHVGSMYEAAQIYEEPSRKEYDRKKAEYWYLKAIEQGSVDALNEIGSLYYRQGGNLPQNYSKAFEWYFKGHQAGLGISSSNVGLMYKNGYGVQQDFAQAEHYFQIAFERGFLKASEHLGDLFQYQPAHRDLDRAKQWYLKGAEQGHVGSQYELGMLYANGFNDLAQAAHWFDIVYQSSNGQYITWIANFYDDGNSEFEPNIPQAIRYFERAATLGDPQAQTNLGFKYEMGEGVAQNHQVALSLYQKAAAQDYPQGINNLATFHKYGMAGLTKDENLSFELYSKAANLENKFAYNNLAKAYYFGIGTAEDDGKACHFFRKAAELEFDDAYYFVGDCYLHGRDGTQDYSQAKRYLELAFKQQDPDAALNLAQIYSLGLGVASDNNRAAHYLERYYQWQEPEENVNLKVGFAFHFGKHELQRDYVLARHYYELAAEQGVANGLNNLGELYRNGLGVTKDLAKAIELYMQVDAMEWGVGSYNLSELYQNGEGVEESATMAFQWMQRSAELGFFNALTKLSEFYKLGYGVAPDMERAKYWLEKAAAEGFYLGQYQLAISYHTGEFGEQDSAKARELLRLAAEQGYAKAQQLLDNDFKGI